MEEKSNLRNHVIDIRHIYKNYYISSDVEQDVLKDINLVVDNGEFVSIMGPSGSGKSTFMNILGCLDRPTKGEYYLNGKNVANLDEDSIADIRNINIGFVFQGFNLLANRTIFENVSMPLIYANCSYEEKRERAYNMLKAVRLEDYMDRLPKQLSGGMQQRVAIARALINNPAVVFADEPTGNLDTKTSYEIMDIFCKLNLENKITIVMVTHEPDIASFSKRLVHIKDGVKLHDCSIKEAKELGIM